MKNLIRYELKKIFKNPLNIILLIAAFAFQFFMMDQILLSEMPDIHLQDNTILSSEAAVHYLNEYYSEHKGIVDDVYIHNMKDEYVSKLNELIDQQKMIQIYGENYEEMMRAG